MSTFVNGTIYPPPSSHTVMCDVVAIHIKIWTKWWLVREGCGTLGRVSVRWPLAAIPGKNQQYTATTDKTIKNGWKTVKICGKPLQFAKIYEILSTFSYAKLSAVWSQRVVKNPRNLLPLFAGEPDQRSGRYSASEYWYPVILCWFIFK